MAPSKEVVESLVEKSDSVAHQYGGNSITGWVALVPSSWVSYIQLARLHPPAGLFLIYFPHLFGILLAGVRVRQQQVSPRSPVGLGEDMTKACVITFGGSFFVSNAIHIWNDLVDAPLDALVSRTRNRPIPRGAVSRSQALVFTMTQALAAVAFLPFLDKSVGLVEAAAWASPGVVAWTYYPFAKRHTHYPQVVLGFCLAWGVVMGCLAMGLRLVAFSSGATLTFAPGVGGIRIDLAALYLFAACMLWSVIYDTVYANQDLEDDVKAGIKSLAVHWKDQTKALLWAILAVMVGLLGACGFASELGVGFYVLAAGGSGATLATMIHSVRLKESASCWWWFGKGFWGVGLAVSSGLLWELV